MSGQFFFFQLIQFRKYYSYFHGHLTAKFEIYGNEFSISICGANLQIYVSRNSLLRKAGNILRSALN